MGLVKSKDTKPELIVRRLVHSMGFRYRLHVSDILGRPDLVLPSRRKIIFVSGCFWHGHHCGACRIPATRRHYWLSDIAKNKSRDQRIRRGLRRDGWEVLTIWECQTRQLESLKKRLNGFLR
jgi:DNA mismatch endonuclease (patch repair protein)